jgi:hypothetical protein
MIHQYLTIRAVRESDAKLGMDLIAENVGSKNASACLFNRLRVQKIRASPLPIKKPKNTRQVLVQICCQSSPSDNSIKDCQRLLGAGSRYGSITPFLTKISHSSNKTTGRARPFKIKINLGFIWFDESEAVETAVSTLG